MRATTITGTAVRGDLAPIVATAGCAVVALAFLTNWPVYAVLVRGNTMLGQAYFLPLLAVFPLLVLRPSSAFDVVREPAFWWYVAFVLLGFIWLVLFDPGDVAQRQWRLRMLAFVHFASIYILARESRQGLVAIVIVACILLAGLCNFLDVMFPHRFLPRGFEGATPERGAGFFINANVASAFILIATITVLPITPMRLRALLLIAAIVGVAPCFSRFAFAFAALLVVGAVVSGLLNRTQILIALLSVPFLFGAAALYYDFLLSSPEANIANVQNRIAWFTNFGRDVDDDSVAGREDAAARAWNMFAEDPLLGQGIGATSHAIQVLGTHNMYLMLMAEQGIFGLALYVSLMALLALRGWQLRRTATSRFDRDTGAALLLAALFLAAFGWSSHNVLEQEYITFSLAFLLAASAGR
jgi:O-antigen ligase